MRRLRSASGILLLATACSGGGPPQKIDYEPRGDYDLPAGDGNSAGDSASATDDNGLPPGDTALPLGIGYCALLGPTPLTVIEAGAPATFSMVLYVAERTPGVGAGADILVGVGFGPSAQGPDTVAWTWQAATYAGDADGLSAGDLANDRYEASLAPPPVGTWISAARASVDGGTSWTYCDLNGPADGFAAANAGTLTVLARSIADARIQLPATIDAVTGTPIEALFAQVRIDGHTPGPGSAANVLAEIGLAPNGTPAGDAAWSWTTALPNPFGPTGDYDEWQASLGNAPAANADLAARFSIDGGTSWVYADLDGSAGGYDAAQAKKLVVGAPNGGGIGWCETQFPADLQLCVGRVQDSGTLYGRVWAGGVTPGSGWGIGLNGAVGWGPTADANAWTWQPAGYRRDVDGGTVGDLTNDEYEGFFRLAPGDLVDGGAYSWAFRFSADAGASWTVCPLHTLVPILCN